MNILNRIFSRSRNDSRSVFVCDPDRDYIIDATGILQQRRRTENGQGNPRDHAMILKELVRFASAEGIRLTVVFTGRPLREAADGSERRGVTINYAATTAALVQKVLLLVKKSSRRRSVVVLTSNPQIENAISSLDAECMRLSTLKKALDGSVEKESASKRIQVPERSAAAAVEPGKAAPASGVRDAAVRTLIDPI